MNRRTRELIFTGVVWLVLIPLGCVWYIISAVDDWRERGEA